MKIQSLIVEPIHGNTIATTYNYIYIYTCVYT